MDNRIGQTVGTNTTVFVVKPEREVAASLDADEGRRHQLLHLRRGLAVSNITETATATNTLTYQL